MFTLSILNIIYDWIEIDHMLEIAALLLFPNIYASLKGIAKIIAYKDASQRSVNTADGCRDPKQGK